MPELSKKIKIVNLIGKIKDGRTSTPITVSHELYSHIFNTFPVFLTDVHKHTNANRDEKVQLIIKKKKTKNGEESLYKGSEEFQYISGVVEKGITGKRKYILDSNENKLVGEVKPTEAVLSPVFFMLIFSWKLNSLFLITENDASENIYSDITSAIRSSIIAHFATDKITMRSEIVLGQDKIIDYIKEGQYSQIKIKRKNIPADIADRVYNVQINDDDECTIEIKISAKKKNFSGILVDRIREIAEDGHPSFRTLEELEPFGLDDDDSEIIVDSTLNGKKRPISISKLKTPNISQVINILLEEDGHSDFDSIRNESLYLFQDIINYK